MITHKALLIGNIETSLVQKQHQLAVLREEIARVEGLSFYDELVRLDIGPPVKLPLSRLTK